MQLKVIPNHIRVYGNSYEIGDDQGFLYRFDHADACVVQRDQRGEDAEHTDVRLKDTVLRQYGGIPYSYAYNICEYAIAG